MLNARAQLLFDYYFNGFYLGFPQPPSQHSQFKQALSLLIFLSRRRSRFFFTSITSVAFCYHHNVTVFITSFSFVVKVWHGQKSSTQNSAIQFLEQLVTGCNLRVMDEPRNLSSNKYFLMSRNELPYIFISVRSEKRSFLRTKLFEHFPMSMHHKLFTQRRRRVVCFVWPSLNIK